MECPVCYCSQANCKLVCGHSFCMQCIKNWYTKCPETASCPMCRKMLYFRGINNKVTEWEEEHRDNLFQKIFEENLDDIFSEIDSRTMLALSFLSSRFDIMRKYDLDLTEDDINFLIFNDYSVIKMTREFRDIQQWKKFIKISKYSAFSSRRKKVSKTRGYVDIPEYILIDIIF